MGLAMEADPVPLRVDGDGTVRVGCSRVTLDTVVAAFNAGSTPEEIVLRYDSLLLEDIYLVLGYYLRNRADVDAYLADRRSRGEARRAEAATRLRWPEVRERLLARRESSDTAPRRG